MVTKNTIFINLLSNMGLIRWERIQIRVYLGGLFMSTNVNLRHSYRNIECPQVYSRQDIQYIEQQPVFTLILGEYIEQWSIMCCITVHFGRQCKHFITLVYCIKLLVVPLQESSHIFTVYI